MKIIFVTAYDSLEYTHEAIKIGVEEFIVKPGSDERTLEILQSCIRQLEEELRKKRQRESLEVKIKQISGYLKNEFPIGSVLWIQTILHGCSRSMRELRPRSIE